ncbi:hypothetical protein EDD55_105100 [Varunaivibrio sulfuroxidans]|uniref:Uncharacterized protein n=2 Tax=Varunaivibrio sulfuroxidans TaxID=1773489 RepID=A0A4R3JAH7_9PROT|nr:hypothetical protein EDD55_105100 [Varunaivibrio sulfuroxidans]
MNPAGFDALGVVETALREIVVTLEAKGLLTREDVAKALLRTEVIADLQDEDGPPTRVTYAERDDWLQRGQNGPDPWDQERRTETDILG